MQNSNGRYLNYIGGEWLDSDRSIEVENPATGKTIASIACAGGAEINLAIERARACVSAELMSKGRPSERAKIIYRIAQEIRLLAPQGAEILVAENGKKLEEARDEFENAARYFEYYAGMTDKIEGKSIPLGEDYIDFTVYEPLGVSAQIVPWNFPVDICARSLAPALAAGNAVIVKSPELTPIAMNFIAKACDQAGLPKGALSIVCGYGTEAGAQRVANPAIDQIVFTGSVATGKSIMHAAAENATPCVMELGGKSAAVVFADADLDVVMDSVDWGIFFNAGQVCSAMSRVIVHADIHDEFVTRVMQLTKSQVLGDGLDRATSLTPVASARQQSEILKLCSTGVEQGARLLTGGKAGEGEGYFVEPTVFSHVVQGSTLFTQEVFGPVLSISSFETPEQAYEMANATEFGLVAGVFTNDLNLAMRASKALKAGQIFVNEWYAGGVETPFGGIKNSGFGREKGQEALYSYVSTKNVAIRLR
jgi:aldehyde dehydrogenase (NAD+)